MKQKRDRSSMRVIHQIDQIDLDRHGVIEASAGTGKTYTIEHLFVSLLEKRKVRSIDEILVVTFTEKAAGELKERIRKNITESLAVTPNAILRASLDEFDTASIFTIHGFCNKLLHEYAFENGEAFECRLVDDRILLRKMLPTILRNVWPSICGEYLSELLKISDYPGITSRGSSAWEERVIEIALRYQPLGNDILYPPVLDDIRDQCKKLEEKFISILDELLIQVGPLDDENPENSGLCRRYTSLNIRKGSIPRRIRMLSKVITLLSIHRSRPVTLTDINDFLYTFSTGAPGFSELNTGWKKNGPDYPEKLPELPQIIEILERLRSIDISALKEMLASITIIELLKHIFEHKKSEGMISYNDMVANLYRALVDDSGTLKHTLHQKYRYALVDEFQDTDMLQWKIFKTLFLDVPANRLYIIGDPKQSIYGFRGADVTAYYIARDEMIQSYEAPYYGLTDNWRSSRELIRLYNTIFLDGTWFSDSSIRYVANNYPDDQNPDYHLGIDPLCVIDCGECSGSEARLVTAAFIAREINTFINRNKTVTPNEIAILVSKWREAETVEHYLKKLGIKYSYYKKEGLYQTREALELSYLLQSFARPDDTAARKRALLTRFFRIPVHSIKQYSDLSSHHPVSVIYRRFFELAEGKKWSLLFQSIIENTGILFHHEMEDRERVLLNLRTIIQDLETHAYTSVGSIQEISDYLVERRIQTPSPHENHNIQKLDIEKPGVQILTIHASKGLQFRIVFIAGGFTRRDMSDFWTYHQDYQRIFDLVRDPEHKDLYDLEMQSEYERLFYVAFTRARDRLYIPLFTPTPKARSNCGILGNLVPRTLSSLKADTHVRWITPRSGSSYPAPDSNPFESPSIISHAIPDPLLPDPYMHFLDRKTEVVSFTLLKSRHHIHTATDHLAIQFGDQARTIDGDDVDFTHFSSDMFLPAHDILPHGKQTGLMLHQVFEQINFSSIGISESSEGLLISTSNSARIIDTAIRNYYPRHHAAWNSFRIEVARLVWNTLRVPLPGLNCRLCDIERKCHEAEFYTHLVRNTDNNPIGNRIPGEFMHGIIDMVFQHQEKFYIVDWKSNFIEGGYEHSNIINNIMDMGYNLQISIYAAGLNAWLKAILPEYSFDRHFGGIFYLYLRGIDPQYPDKGIFFIRPDNESSISRSLSFTPSSKTPNTQSS